MRRVIIGNPVIDNTYKTYLSSQYTSGKDLSILSNVSFSVGDIIILGEPGEELTEAQRITALSGKTTVTLLDTPNFSHAKDTPVYRVPWNFAIIEGRALSTDPFATLTESPIQWDKRDTIYFHQAGTGTWQYRFRYWNSVTNTYSDYSPTVSGSGFSRNQVGFMLGRVRVKTKDFDARIADDDEIIGFFNDAQDIIYGRNPKYWFLYVDSYKAGNGIAATAGNNVYSLANYTTLGVIKSIRYKYTSGNTSSLGHIRKLSDIEFDREVTDLNTTSDDFPKVFKLLPPDATSSTGYIQLNVPIKTTGVGTLYPNYYEKMADLDTVDDTTQVPLPALLENFAIGQIERIRGNDAKAQVYEDLFWGPSDKRVAFQKLQGLPLLDRMDNAQKDISDEPKSLMRFRGRKAIRHLYNDGPGGWAAYQDYKENYW